MDVVQWLKLWLLLVDWQSPRGTLTPWGEARWDGILFFATSGNSVLGKTQGERKIFTHSLSACGET
jgi:hypothetical protein